MGVDDVAARLAKAGYNRGSFMEKLLASRIVDAAAVLDDRGIQRLRELEESGNTTGIREVLLVVKGVGHEVASNVLILRS